MIFFLCFLGFSEEHKGGWLCALWVFPIEEALLQPGPFLQGWSWVSAPCGPGAASAKAEWSLKLWGLQMELAELIWNLFVNPLLAMSSSMEVAVVSVEASVAEASSSLSPVYEELLEVVTLAMVKLSFDWSVGK